MASSKQVARRGSAGVATTGAPDGLREVIQEALRGYELAITARLKAEREAAGARSQHLGALAKLEERADEERERAEQAEQAVATAEAARIETLARLAAETEQTAVRLLEASALAHIRGTGDALTGAVHPHTATDEQAAGAFAEAQTAAVDLRATLLRLARAYLDSRDWEAARAVLLPVHSETNGPFKDEAAALLRASYRAQAAAAIADSDWDQARAVSESAQVMFPGSLGTDPVLARQFAQATRELAMAATDAGRTDDAQRYIAQAQEMLGDGHQELRGLTRGVLGWAGVRGPLTCLHVFSSHRQPVLDVAVTADGEDLVSVDGDQVYTWRLSGPGGLGRTIPAPGAFALTGGAGMAVTTDGALLRTDDGSHACTLAGAIAGSVTAFTSSADGRIVAWACREPEPTRTVNLEGEYGYAPFFQAGHPASPSDVALLAPLRFAHGFTRRPLRTAMQVAPLQGNPNYRYRTAYFQLVTSLHVADGLAGNALRNIEAGPDALILSLALPSSADFVAWLNPRGFLHITDIATGLVRYTFPALAWQTSYDTITISRSDRLVAVAHSQMKATGWESTVTAWDLATGGEAFSWTFGGITGGIAFAPDERLIAALTTEGDVGLYDIEARKPLAATAAHGMADYPRITFSPDGSRLVTSGDRAIKVWGLPD